MLFALFGAGGTGTAGGLVVVALLLYLFVPLGPIGRGCTVGQYANLVQGTALVYATIPLGLVIGQLGLQELDTGEVGNLEA